MIALISLSGCAASQVLVASYEDETAKCPELEYELEESRVRLQKLAFLCGGLYGEKGFEKSI